VPFKKNKIKISALRFVPLFIIIAKWRNFDPKEKKENDAIDTM